MHRFIGSTTILPRPPITTYSNNNNDNKNNHDNNNRNEHNNNDNDNSDEDDNINDAPFLLSLSIFFASFAYDT